MRHPELKPNIPPPSCLARAWCPNFEFRAIALRGHGTSLSYISLGVVHEPGVLTLSSGGRAGKIDFKEFAAGILGQRVGQVEPYSCNPYREYLLQL